MTNSINQPEFETLDYRSPGPTEQLVSASPATLGLNSAVTKPEMRVNKACPLKEPLKEGQKPICGDKCEDQNLKIISEIEGLISQVNENLAKLSDFNLRKAFSRFDFKIDDSMKNKVSQAIEEIDLFQKTTLFELRKAFE